jgi:hypothetical protein
MEKISADAAATPPCRSAPVSREAWRNLLSLLGLVQVRSPRFFITKMAVALLEASENYTAIFSAVFWSARSNKTLLNPCFEKLIA